MTKLVFIIYLNLLFFGSIVTYKKECSIGPEYWCKTFQNADDCGALKHCIDTVWINDNKFKSTCQLCEKTFSNFDQNEISLTNICESFKSNDFSSKCLKIIENYEKPVVLLMKNKRFATLCYLMEICSNELITEETKINLGSRRCTWGPSYWCSSLKNSRECHSIEHCSNNIWSKQTIKKTTDDNICQYCQFIIDKLNSIITLNQTEINFKQWLSGGCQLLKREDLINQCLTAVNQYTDEIIILIKNQIDSGIICHLIDMCKDSTIEPRKDSKEQSTILCNIIVRATHELYSKQGKNRYEIKKFLKHDCLKLSTHELIQKCDNFLDKHGADVYQHVTNKMELSKICDFIDETAVKPLPNDQCQLCKFTLQTTKKMFDNENSNVKKNIFKYIDEQFCSRLNGQLKTNCKYLIENNYDELIDKIRQEKELIFLCNYFQVCIDEIYTEINLDEKEEFRSNLKTTICDRLGVFQKSCQAFFDRDSNRLLKTLFQDLNGDVLCQIFGICPMEMSFIDDLSIRDDKNKCNRCINDFTRRKHIAEKLVTHSSEFLHHLCAQLPQKDDCNKAVDDSISKLTQFIQSLNPQDICVELKICNQTLIESNEIILLDNSINKEIIVFIKKEICMRIGPLSKLCNKIIDVEGENILNDISKNLNPNEICSIIDICPTTKSFENCSDKCQCCQEKIETYQIQLAGFLETILMTTKTICQHMPNSDECRQTADKFQSDINEIIFRFNTKQICQSLTYCSVDLLDCNTENDKCQCCQNQIKIRQNNFRQIINEIKTFLDSLCIDEDCRLIAQSNQQQILDKINQINSFTICQRFAFCSSSDSHRSIPFLSHLLLNAHQSLGPTTEQLSNNICSNFENFQTICEHLLTSRENTQFINVYMALLKNDPTIIENDLRKQNKDNCEICKQTVQTKKDFWMNSLDVVRNALLQGCEYCSVKDQCRNYINQRFDNLKSYVDKINPEDFCKKIQLCSTSATNSCITCVQRLQMGKNGVLQTIQRLSEYFYNLCQKSNDDDCQLVAQQIYDLIQISIEEFDSNDACVSMGFCSDNGENFQQYEQYLQEEFDKNICSIFGPFETLCKSIIHGNTQQIQEFNINNYDIKDLMQIGQELTKDSFETKDDDEFNTDKCRCCIFRVIRRKQHIKRVGHRIFRGLIRACDYSPTKVQCRRHWRKAEMRFNLRIERINPKRVCIHRGFCNKVSIPDYIENEHKSLVEYKQIDNENTTCILCEYVMNILSNYIHCHSTEEEIKESVQNICKQLPSILENQCLDYIDNYGPAIIATLINEFDLSNVCHKLNICINDMNFDVTYLTEANTTICGICDYIATYVHFAMKRDSNDKSLQHALSTVCSHLSNEQNLKCQILVHLFSPHIRQLQLGSTNNFCQQLTICETPMIELKPAIKIDDTKYIDPIDTIESSVQDEIDNSIGEHVPKTPQCEVCHYVISYLDAALKNNISEQAVEQELKKVCTHLPSKLRDQCVDFVKNYGPVIAEVLVDTIDPDTTCRYLKLCQDSSAKELTTMSNSERAEIPYTCSICQFIIIRMKSFVDLNQDENEIRASIKSLCDLFSVNYLKEECNNFLEKHGSYLFQTISDDVQPRTICQNIGTCKKDNQQLPTTATTSAPVASSTQYGKCIFGMNYWCMNRETAKLCNAVELCQRHVWSKKNIVIT